MAKKTAPYATWSSPITSDAITKETITIVDVLVDAVTGVVYHVEGRPSEGGRNVVVATKDGKDVFGKDFNARTGVHEYGGGAAIVHDGAVYFSNFTDSFIYKVLAAGGEPEPVVPANANYRFADFNVHPTHPSLLVTILEDHTKPHPSDVVNTLAIIDTATKRILPLVSGADFYAAPRFSPDGAHLAWVQWYHPDMPWEGSELHIADIAVTAGAVTLTNDRHIAGKKLDVSVAYPFWLPTNALLFTSDERAPRFQNPQISTDLKSTEAALAHALEQEFGGPAWLLAGSPGATLDSRGARVLFAASNEGRAVFHVLDVAGRASAQIASPYVNVDAVRFVSENTAVFVGTKVDEPAAVVLVRISDAAGAGAPQLDFETLKSTGGHGFAFTLFSVPQPITLKVGPNDEPLHVVYYPPTNPDYSGSSVPGERPPAVVNSHGGPTSKNSQGLSMLRQFFTSRGWAWVDVDYGGSSGYGRVYIDRLAGQWGIVDVEDSITSVEKLGAAPYSLVDPARLALRGGSSGGFTVLAALSHATKPTTFAAGTSSYGISNLERLAGDTHKFESHYIQKLLGGTLAEIPEVYYDRSPVNHADRIKSPLLILQGSEDAVVPPSQAELIVETIKKDGGQVEYHVFEGEGHGWRKAENIKQALEWELGFYEKTFNLKA